MTRLTMTAAMAGLMMSLGNTAMAGDFSFSLGIFKSEHDGNRVSVGLNINRGRVEPVRYTRVPATYRIVTEKVWVPTTETVYRDVPVLDHCGNVIAYKREATVIQTGYWTTVERQELVRPAHTVITDGSHWHRRRPAEPVHATRTVSMAAPRHY